MGYRQIVAAVQQTYSSFRDIPFEYTKRHMVSRGSLDVFGRVLIYVSHALYSLPKKVHTSRLLLNSCRIRISQRKKKPVSGTPQHSVLLLALTQYVIFEPELFVALIDLQTVSVLNYFFFS
jgi:hypothetical protein